MLELPFYLATYTSIFPDQFIPVVQGASLHLPSDKAAHFHTESLFLRFSVLKNTFHQVWQ